MAGSQFSAVATSEPEIPQSNLFIHLKGDVTTVRTYKGRTQGHRYKSSDSGSDSIDVERRSSQPINLT